MSRRANLQSLTSRHDNYQFCFSAVISCLIIALWLAILGISSIAQSEEVMITQIEASRDRGFDYLDIYTTGRTSGKGLMLENKLYIDFPNTKISPKIEISPRKSKRIHSIKAEQKDAETARIIITLKKEIDYDVVNVFGRDKTVVEISDRLNNIAGHQLAWESHNIIKKTQPLKPIRLEPTTTKKTDYSLKGKTIVIDPGHGGDDPGALSITGVPEKQLTLKTAQRTAALLREAGATVYLTRDEDRRSNLKDVSAFANKIGADIFISIHYNSTYHSKICGTETYYYNRVSRKFAEIMHETIIRGIKRRDRGLHRTPFYVIKNAEMPSVLLEPVYLTSCDDNDLANSAAWQAELAQYIVKGVKTYFRDKSN